MTFYGGLSTLPELSGPVTWHQIKWGSSQHASAHDRDASPQSSYVLTCNRNHGGVVTITSYPPVCFLLTDLTPVDIITIHRRLWCALFRIYHVVSHHWGCSSCISRFGNLCGIFHFHKVLLSASKKIYYVHQALLENYKSKKAVPVYWKIQFRWQAARRERIYLVGY